MKEYIISNLILKIISFILMFLWFISKYIITSITGYEWIPVFITAILFLDLFLLQMLNVPKFFKKDNFTNKFFLFGESIYKYNKTGDKRFCTEIPLDRFICEIKSEETVLMHKEKDYMYFQNKKLDNDKYTVNIAYIKSEEGLKKFFKEIDYDNIKRPEFGL